MKKIKKINHELCPICGEKLKHGMVVGHLVKKHPEYEHPKKRTE